MQAMDQPTHHSELGQKFRALKQMQVLLGTRLLVGLVETLQKLIGSASKNPRNINSWISHVCGRKTSQRADSTVIDMDRCLGQITVDRGGKEAPQGQILQGLFPAVPQVRRNNDFLRGLVQDRLMAIATLDS